MSEILGTLLKVLLAVLGVVAVVVIMYSALSANKTQTEVANLTQLASNIQTTYAGQSSFTGVTNTVVVTGKFAPSSMMSGTNTLTNAWGGSVTVAVGSPTSQFTVTEAGVPSDGCIKLATSIASPISVTVGGTAVTDVSSAATNCTGATNSLVFTFGR